MPVQDTKIAERGARRMESVHHFLTCNPDWFPMFDDYGRIVGLSTGGYKEPPIVFVYAKGEQL